LRELQGKVAFVTGAASGIGMGIAQALAAQGVRLAVADVREAALDATATALAQAGARVLALPLDVTDRAGLRAAAARIERELGPVDVLCSNAGVNFVGPTPDATFEDWDFCLGVNLGGAVNVVRTFVPGMIERRAGGHVLITSSVSGLFTSGGSGCYVTSKFALVGLAESLRADLAAHGIGVSVLCPGPVQSELFESTLAVRPRSLAATGSVPIIAPGVRREDTPIFATALTPSDVGQCVVRGIQRNDMYIMTHAEIRPVLEARAASLLAALPPGPIDPRRIEASRGLLDASLYQHPQGDPDEQRPL
jgi:NAD(P)-dependent dehydrogenase (short-subunit alcohol dehydrogenase family)